MKKIVLFTIAFVILAGLSLASFIPKETPAPLEDYAVDVYWNDDDCTSCGILDEILLDIEIWDVSSTPQKIDYSYGIDITNETQPYTHEGLANIIWNCQGCYEVRVKIEYYDNEGLCCDGANTVSCDGEDLINEDVIIWVTLD